MQVNSHFSFYQFCHIEKTQQRSSFIFPFTPFSSVAQDNNELEKMGKIAATAKNESLVEVRQPSFDVLLYYKYTNGTI